MADKNGVSMAAAAAVVMGNMIGTGVFTSLGFQLQSLSSNSAILFLWLLGGLLAFCGAACYAELAATFPRSGGEYHFLTSIYGPAIGFVTGWASLIAGFAAPVALSSLAFGTYLEGIFGLGPKTLALSVLSLLTLTHLWNVRSSARVQSMLTYAKVAAILVFLGAASLHMDAPRPSLTLNETDFANVFSTSFALSLVYVMYAYAGWNAATYIIGEIRDPERNVPRALFLGTGFVTLLYLFLNGIFLLSTPRESMTGKIEIGLIVGRELFGPRGGTGMALLIGFGLISSISAMLWVGSRIGQRMGEDHPSLGVLARSNRHGLPFVAVLFQALLAAILILTASFDAILVYIESVLLLTSGLAVFGLFLLRHRERARPRTGKTIGKTIGYPFTPIVFLLITVWMILAIAWKRPVESLLGWATFFSGALVYAHAVGKARKRS